MADEKVATAYPKDFTSCLNRVAHKLIVVDNGDQLLFWHIVLLHPLNRPLSLLN
jgi:hypothetical protein